MTSSLRCAVILAVTLCSCVAAGAQQSDAEAKMASSTRAFVLKQRQLPEYRESIQKNVLAYVKSLDIKCGDVTLDFDSPGVRDMLLDPVESDDKGVAVAGRWREVVPATACGEKRRFTVEVEVTPQGTRYTALFPGEAQGNPELERDTLSNIEMNFQVLRIPVKKNCHIDVIDTLLVGPSATMQDNGILSPWKESWEVRTCGKVYVVPITFKSDGKGTFIDVATSEIHPQ